MKRTDTITLTLHKNAQNTLVTIKDYIREAGIIDEAMEQALVDQAAHCFGILGRGNPRFHAEVYVLEAIKEAK